jgi:peptide chain release factor 1
MPQLTDLKKEFAQITAKLAQPQKLSAAELSRLSARAAELRELLSVAEEVEKLEKQIRENKALAKDPDAELAALARSELDKLRPQLQKARARLQQLLKPENPLDRKPALMEFRAGTGGDEAALFARDLLEMYTKYAEKKGWPVQLVSLSRTDLGGVREAVVEINAQGAYGALRHEAGVHRVQRIPETEKSGRIHTSTATVAVLPLLTPREFEIKKDEIRIDTFRASGAGGQYVNKTSSAVRITHLPTNTVVTVQDERSQQRNRERAMRILRARLAAAKAAEQAARTAAARRAQIGGAERAEKIRTYNFPQDRVTDHRLQRTWHGLTNIFAGELDELINAWQDKDSS